MESKSAASQAERIKKLNEEENKYIRPTKKSPVFVAQCDWFGFIEENLWKEYLVNTPDGGHIGRTFAIRYHDAVNGLHEWIKENPETLKEYPKCKFDILLVDGSWDRHNDPVRKKVYTISAAKAKQLLF